MSKRLTSLFALLVLVPAISRAQCTQPTVDDSLNCDFVPFFLDVNGGGALHYWYDSPTSDSLIAVGANYTTPTLTASDSFFIAEYDTGTTTTALRFDGASDYAAISSYWYASSGIPELTVETWVRTSDSTTQIIASFDRS